MKLIKTCMVSWLCFTAYQPLLGYLMPNSVHTYISNIHNNSLLITFLNEPGLICLNPVKWFQVLLSDTVLFVCNEMVLSIAI